MALSKIGTNSLEDLSVTSGKVANDGIGPTQLDETANYAFTGTVTGAGGVNTPAFAAYSSDISGFSSGVTTKLSVGEVYDTNSAYDGTTFTVPSGEAGKYFIYLNGSHYATGSDATIGYVRIYLNGSNSRIGELYNISSFINHHNNVSTSLSLSVGDTIEAYASTNGSGAIGLGTVNFGAYKIIE